MSQARMAAGALYPDAAVTLYEVAQTRAVLCAAAFDRDDRAQTLCRDGQVLLSNDEEVLE